MIQVLEEINSGGGSDVMQVIFNQKKASTTGSEGINGCFQKNLAPYQKMIISFAMNQKDIAIITGPSVPELRPILVELILQAGLKSKLKVLLASKTTDGLNSIHSDLIKINSQFDLYVTRIDSDVPSDHTSSHISSKIAADELLEYLEQSNDPEKVSKYRKDLKEIKLMESQIIMSTLADASPDGHLEDYFKSCAFDLLILTDCSEIKPTEALIVMKYAKKIMIVGEANQAVDSSNPNLMQFMMERFKSDPESVMRNVQQQILKQEVTVSQSNSSVQQCINESFDESSPQPRSSSLKSSHHSSHSNGTIGNQSPTSRSQLTPKNGMEIIVQPNPVSSLVEKYQHLKPSEYPKYLMIDTQYAGWTESCEDIGRGIIGTKNDHEIQVIVDYVQKLLENGINHCDIGVTAPYLSQVNIFRSLLKGIFITSYAGKQRFKELKEIVIISMVRSNNDGKIGIAADPKKFDYAVSRAKSHLVLVCDSSTVSRDPYVKTFINKIEAEGSVRFQPDMATDSPQAVPYCEPKPIIQLPEISSIRTAQSYHEITPLFNKYPHLDPLDYPKYAMIDTQYAGFTESFGGKVKTGFKNRHEVQVIMNYVQKLIDSGITAGDIGIITPYVQQSDMLRGFIKHGIYIQAIRNYQRFPQEVVILSMVRSNSDGDVGLLEDSDLFDFAVSRAKSHLVLVCDSNTVSRDPHIRSFIDKIESVSYDPAINPEIPRARFYQNLQLDQEYGEPDAGYYTAGSNYYTEAANYHFDHDQRQHLFPQHNLY